MHIQGREKVQPPEELSTACLLHSTLSRLLQRADESVAQVQHKKPPCAAPLQPWPQPARSPAQQASSLYVLLCSYISRAGSDLACCRP